MKICWDNLEGLYLSKNNKFRYKIHGGMTLYYHDKCLGCGYPFLGKKNSKYCERKCSNISNGYVISETRKGIIFSEKHKKNISKSKQGKKSSLWKGGYCTKNIATYDTFQLSLKKYEPIRRSPLDKNVLEVKCRYCGKWFIPLYTQVKTRIRGLDNDYGRFYCSEDCKILCPIYGQQIYYKGQKGTNSREVQPELRQLVMERDKWTCQKCGQNGGKLQCHHISPVKENPVESADVDNCITLCVECHKEVHKIPGCGYQELKECING